MKIITISREFGSGGRELGKRLAGLLGYDYYDREIITAIAEKQGLDETYVENALNHQGWKTVPLTYGRTFSLGAVQQPKVQINLLVEQKRVMEEIAKAGRDCVIVGRNADILLWDQHPLNLFVCAAPEAKVRRCMERAEGALSRREIERNLRRIDKARAQTRAMLTHTAWGQRDAYHLVVNTTDWDLQELAAAVADFAARWFGRNS